MLATRHEEVCEARRREPQQARYEATLAERRYAAFHGALPPARPAASSSNSAARRSSSSHSAVAGGGIVAVRSGLGSARRSCGQGKRQALGSGHRGATPPREDQYPFQLRQQMFEVPQRLDGDLRRTHAQRSAGRRVEDPGRAAQHDAGRDVHERHGSGTRFSIRSMRTRWPKYGLQR